MSDEVDAFDAIVIGSGINGLVAAAELGKTGWSVALFERSDDLGGFIATEELTLPGYRHDTYSSWHPLFVSGPAYAALGDDLHRDPVRAARSASSGPVERRAGLPSAATARASCAPGRHDSPGRRGRPVRGVGGGLRRSTEEGLRKEDRLRWRGLSRCSTRVCWFR